MATKAPETLEEAKAMLLENSNTINELNQQITNLTTQNTEKDNTINDLRTLNQKYYLQLAQGTDPDPEPEPEPSETLEEFAKNNLKGMIK